jgi:hypothetical protein
VTTATLPDSCGILISNSPTITPKVNGHAEMEVSPSVPGASVVTHTTGMFLWAAFRMSRLDGGGLAWRDDDAVRLVLKRLFEKADIAFAKPGVRTKLELRSGFERCRGFLNSVANGIEERTRSPPGGERRCASGAAILDSGLPDSAGIRESVASSEPWHGSSH